MQWRTQCIESVAMGGCGADLQAWGDLGLVEGALLLHLRELARHAVVRIHRRRALLLVAGTASGPIGFVGDGGGEGGAL